MHERDSKPNKRQQANEAVYLERLAKKYKGVVVFVGVYTTRRTLSLHQCAVCRFKWRIYPSSLLNSRYKVPCPRCAGFRNQQKTDREYRIELALIAPNVRCTGHYTKSLDKTEHTCVICNHRWQVKPNTLLSRGRGCPRCGKRKASAQITKSDIEYRQQLKDRKIPAEPLSKYVGNKIKIPHKCKNCGFVWDVKPNLILDAGRGCPQCACSGFDKAASALLYYLISPDRSESKIGITNHGTVTARFSASALEGYEVFSTPFDTGQECREVEESLHCRFSHLRQESDRLRSYGGHTEWFSGDPLKLSGLGPGCLSAKVL